jgi:cell division protein FtsB
MPNYTLGQAAKATGRSKAGLLDAIRGGRISASRNDKNQWQIDPAELHRVYPVAVQPEVKDEREQTPENTVEHRLLEEKLVYLERTVVSLERERDDLRTDRDQWREQARLALITYQPPQREPEQRHRLEAHPALWLLLAMALAVAGWHVWPWRTG